MDTNTMGYRLRLTSFGESHGPAVGGVLQGFPSGVEIDTNFIGQELDKRRPDRAVIGSSRKEDDELEILSGVFEGKSLGSPIAFLIRNKDAQSQDYELLKHAFRPGHADDTYQTKYGLRDYRGGGRASARTTAVLVAAGAFAKLLLRKYNIHIYAYTSQIGDIVLSKKTEDIHFPDIYTDPFRCPCSETSQKIENLWKKTIQEKDSLGGCVSCIIQGVPAGLGEPIFAKFQAALASAMLSINACKGFEYGRGFQTTFMKGSEHNDQWNGQGKSKQNLAGGIRGGISTGEDIYFRTAFKPIASIQQEILCQEEDASLKKLSLGGRHDICCVPRAVPVVENTTALIIADFLLLQAK